MGRAEYHTHLRGLGGTIAVNLAQDANQSGISRRLQAVFKQAVKSAAVRFPVLSS